MSSKFLSDIWYTLDVCVASKIHMLTPDPQGRQCQDEGPLEGDEVIGGAP